MSKKIGLLGLFATQPGDIRPTVSACEELVTD